MTEVWMWGQQTWNGRKFIHQKTSRSSETERGRECSFLEKDLSLESQWKHTMATRKEAIPGLRGGTNRCIPQSPRVLFILIYILYEQRL